MNTAQRHPTGLAASGAAVLVIVLAKCGVDFSAEEAATIVGFIGAAVSAVTPRLHSH